MTEIKKEVIDLVLDRKECTLDGAYNLDHDSSIYRIMGYFSHSGDIKDIKDKLFNIHFTSKGDDSVSIFKECVIEKHENKITTHTFHSKEYGNILSLSGWRKLKIDTVLKS